MAQHVRNPVTLETYDLAGETTRTVLPDVVVSGKRLNRATATVKITAPVEDERTHAARARSRCAGSAIRPRPG